MCREVMKALLVAIMSSVLLPLLSSCASSSGYANNAAGRRSRMEFCESVRRFVRAPLDSEGLRRAWFLPMGVNDEGDEISIDLYAPMASNPSDEYSHAFYRDKVGQLTHYVLAPEHALAMANCLTGRHGFERKTLTMEEDHLRGSFLDQRSNRRIEIRATEDTTSILIASMEWKGELDETLQFRCSADFE
jgi:hypothetical protein